MPVHRLTWFLRYGFWKEILNSTLLITCYYIKTFICPIDLMWIHTLYMKEISNFWLNHLILKVWTFKCDIKTRTCSVDQAWCDFFLDYLIHSLDFEVGLTIWRSCHVTHKCTWLMFFNILSDIVDSLSNPYPFQSEVDPVLSSKVNVIFYSFLTNFLSLFHFMNSVNFKQFYCIRLRPCFLLVIGYVFILKSNL